MLYILATDIKAQLTFVATTSRRGSRKICYHVMPATGRCLDTPVSACFVPLYFRRAAKAALNLN